MTTDEKIELIQLAARTEDFTVFKAFVTDEKTEEHYKRILEILITLKSRPLASPSFRQPLLKEIWDLTKKLSGLNLGVYQPLPQFN